MSKTLLKPTEKHAEFGSINVSTSKQNFSFPKDSRFPKIKESYCASAAYEISRGFEPGFRKGASFGYGNRFYRKSEDSPEPGRYNSTYEFVSSKKKEPKFSFGGSRNSFDKKEIPGPGSYQPFTDFGKESKKLSFGGRTKSFHEIPVENPGPGTYNWTKDLGKSPGVVSYKSGLRFRDNSNGIPGPGSYTARLDKDSPLDHKKGGKWGHENKRGMEIRSSLEVPGPGSYKIVRDFGNF